jgi:hypothetical protein
MSTTIRPIQPGVPATAPRGVDPAPGPSAPARGPVLSSNATGLSALARNSANGMRPRLQGNLPGGAPAGQAAAPGMPAGLPPWATKA